MYLILIIRYINFYLMDFFVNYDYKVFLIKTINNINNNI